MWDNFDNTGKKYFSCLEKWSQKSKNLVEGVHNPPINPSPNNVAFINAFMVYSIQTEILELLLFLIWLYELFWKTTKMMRGANDITLFGIWQFFGRQNGNLGKFCSVFGD